MIALILLFTLGIIITVFIIVGMTLSDITEIRSKRLIKKHPYSRKLRERPLVYILIDGIASEELLQSIKKNRYKKLTIITKDSLPRDALVLSVNAATTLELNSVLNAVQQMAIDTKRKTVAITPVISLKHSVLAIFHIYHVLARLPFTVAKAGFGIASHDSLSRTAKHDEMYSFGRQLFKIINSILFIYACYAAANLNQPELLLVYLFATSFWLVWSIIRYPYFSVVRKIALVLLSPVSLVYFVYLTIAAPFAPVRLHVNRQNAIIKV